MADPGRILNQLIQKTNRLAAQNTILARKTSEIEEKTKQLDNRVYRNEYLIDKNNMDKSRKIAEINRDENTNNFQNETDWRMSTIQIFKSFDDRMLFYIKLPACSKKAALLAVLMNNLDAIQTNIEVNQNKISIKFKPNPKYFKIFKCAPFIAETFSDKRTWANPIERYAEKMKPGYYLYSIVWKNQSKWKIFESNYNKKPPRNFYVPIYFITNKRLKNVKNNNPKRLIQCGKND
eukprot:UN09749